MHKATELAAVLVQASAVQEAKCLLLRCRPRIFGEHCEGSRHKHLAASTQRLCCQLSRTHVLGLTRQSTKCVARGISHTYKSACYENTDSLSRATFLVTAHWLSLSQVILRAFSTSVAEYSLSTAAWQHYHKRVDKHMLRPGSGEKSLGALQHVKRTLA